MTYKIVRKLVEIFLRLFNHWEIRGLENFPTIGPVVVVANHTSYWDPPVVACSLRRTVHFMAKEELFKVPLLNILLPHLQCFPVKRGKADRNALRMSLKYLASGEVLGIFPEGTRSKNGEMQTFEQGAALIAIKGGAAIVPVGLLGTSQAFPASWRGNIVMNIGQPLYYPELENAKLNNEELEKVNMDIVESIKKLLQVK